jgi:drug/metabolite transporter (DMT)-like permease
VTITRSRFAFLYALMCLIWGSTWLVIHIGSDAGLPPFTGASMRFGLAALIMWGWLYWSGAKLPTTRTEWRAIITVGLLSNGVSFAIAYWCSQYLPSGLMAVIFGTMPLWTAIFSHLAIETERMSVGRIMGIIIGIAGLTTIFFPKFIDFEIASVVPMIALLGSPLVSAVSTVVTKRYTHEVSPITLNTIATTTGFMLLSAIALTRENMFEQSYTFTHAWTIGYLAILGSIVAFVSYFSLMKHTSPVTMSYITLVSPTIAVFLGWLILGEQLGVNELVGAGLVLAGAKLAIRMT